MSLRGNVGLGRALRGYAVSARVDLDLAAGRLAGSGLCLADDETGALFGSDPAVRVRVQPGLVHGVDRLLRVHPDHVGHRLAATGGQANCESDSH